MENVTSCGQRLDELQRKAKAQVNALTAMQEVYAQETVYLDRQEQARCLDILAKRVEQEVTRIQMMESAAASEFRQKKLDRSVSGFFITGLTTAAFHPDEHPIAAGLRAARDELARTAPFGTVVVAIGPGGMPEDVSVISLSLRAQVRGSSEREAAAALESEGYHVMPPEVFSVVLNEAKEKIAMGTLALPVAASSLAGQSTSKSLNGLSSPSPPAVKQPRKK